jgi:ribosomal protein S18 acetylase RimI-like enzyme
MKKLEKGLEKEKLNEEEKKVFSDFEKMKLLSELKIRPIRLEEFEDAMNILNKELGEERVRRKEFLYKKFKEYPSFFIGAFLDNKIVGIICGFPREDYLLMSEIAIDLRFHNRNFGKRLVEKFENSAEKNYNKIEVGAEDNAIGFYESIKYKPFLLIQFEKKDYLDKEFDNFKIIKKYDFDKDNRAIEVKVRFADLKQLIKLKKKYPKAWFQYIFIKNL